MAIKDSGKESIKYLSLFLILVGNIPPRIQQGMETLLGPLFVVDVFVKTFFAVSYNSGQPEL